MTDKNKNIEAIYPLSPTQSGMLFHSIYEDDAKAYFNQFSCRIHGSLDADAFEHSWRRVLERHPILRTLLLWKNRKKPLQVVLKNVSFAVDRHDWRDSAADWRERLAAFLEEDRGRGFDLDRPPLMRCALIQTAEDSHAFVWSFHHLLLDGWSLPIVLGEVFHFYQGEVAGKRLDLPAPPPYKHYISWLQKQDRDAIASYWREGLQGFREPNAIGGAIGSIHLEEASSQDEFRLHLSEETTQRLTALAREHRLTLNTIAMAAWSLLLGRYSSDRDLLFGITVSGRPPELPGIEGMVGLMINTLPARVRLDESRALLPWLTELHEAQVTREQHGYATLPEIQSWSEVPPGQPLFRSIMIFESSSAAALLNENTPFEITDAGTFEETNYPFTVVFQPGKQMLLRLRYETSFASAAMVRTMLDHLAFVLEGIAADPNRSLSDFGALTESERERVLRTWNDTHKDFGEAGGIVALFRARAARSPELPALQMAREDGSLREGDVWTRAALDQAVNRLAHHLRGLGLSDEQPVGICLDRSPEMVLGILAVMAAGGAYVPINPSDPPDRKALILEETGAGILLTRTGTRDSQPDFSGAIICLDACPELEGCAATPLEPVTGDRVAYIMFTSGSTGRPKGVQVSHAAIGNRLLWARDAYPLTEQDRFLQIAAFGFDISLWEIAAPLISGARLVLAPVDAHRDPDLLAELVARYGITAIHFVPTLLKAFLQVENLERARELRMVFCGGEALTPDIRRQFLDRLDAALYHFYGPTEAAINATAWDARKQAPGDLVPIGRPIDNAAVYLLDRNMDPVPVGTHGELFLGGTGLARGYFGKPSLTAERFIPNPFGGGGARLYKTGDRGYHLDNGDIVFAGRVDHQIKLRGIRIEPGEIEAVLESREDVAHAVVLVQTLSAGNDQLVGYVVAEADTVDLTPVGDDAIELWPSVGEYKVYDDLIYSGLTADVDRNVKYRTALEKAAAGKVVIDIGTGSDAIQSRLAIEAGAAKVYAVEIDEEAYQKAKARVADLGLADRIEVVHGNALTIDLPEKGDVCVSEIVESLGGAEGAASIINDAHRLLKPDGVMIPDRSVTLIAAMRLPDTIHDEPVFNRVPGGYAERIFEQVGRPFDLRLGITNFPKSHLISNAEIFEDLQHNGHSETEFERRVTLTIREAGRLDGFLLWLRLHLDETEVIDILGGPSSWYPIVFPVFWPGVEVAAGDRLEVTCSGALAENTIYPDYSVRGSLRRQDGQVVDFQFTSYHHGGAYRSLPFYEAMFSEDRVPIRERLSKAEFTDTLRETLRKRLPEPMIPARLVPLASLPLTPNGKLDRAALPVPGTVRTGGSAERVTPRNETEAELAAIWAEVLGHEQVGIHDNYFALGGDSILSIQIIARARKVGLQLNPRQLFKHNTIAELAAIAKPPELTRAEIEPVTGEVPLTPIQALFFEKHKGAQPFNMALLLKVVPSLDEAILSRAVGEILTYHDGLRTQFSEAQGQVRQTILPPDETIPFEIIDLTDLPDDRRNAALTQESEKIQAGLSYSSGPLIRVALFRLGRPEDRLLIAVHHLVMDAVSWQLILNDLGAAYVALSAGNDVPFPAKTTSFKEWSQRLTELADSETAKAEKAYWETLLTEAGQQTLPMDTSNTSLTADTVGASNTVTAALDPEQTRLLLQDVSATYRTRIDEILLSALALTLSDWTGKTELLIDLEGHGREPLFEDVDLSHTIGWFTALYPVALEVADRDPGRLIKAVKERLRAVPRGGIGYGLLRYLARGDHALPGNLPSARVAFNYLGRTDSMLSEDALFRPADEPIGNDRDPDDVRDHLLEFNVWVEHGSLRVGLTHGTAFHTAETATRLAESFIADLGALVEHCLSPEAGGYTPSDFPLARLDQDTLDRIVAGREVEDIYPLSSMQSGILFHNLYDTGFDPYFEQITCVFRGNFNIPAFKKSWRRITARFELLRTSFAWENLSQHLQLVHPEAEPEWIHEDWRGLDAEALDASLNAYLARDRERGFDLGEAPLMRFALMRVEEDAYRFVWSHHHLLMDGWSRTQLFNELLTVYTGLDQGIPVTLPPAPPYSTYIAWLEEQDQERAATYWRDSLAGFTSANIPTISKEVPAGSERVTRYRAHKLSIPEDVSGQITAMAARERLTVSILAQAAWGLLLSRYCESKDILFGATFSGRPPELPGVEEIMGLFINTLPVRMNTASDAKLLPWLHGLQEDQLQRESFAYTPLAQIQSYSDVPSGNRLFETIVIIDNYPEDPRGEQGYDRLSLEDFETYEHTNFPLNAAIRPGREIAMSITYDTDYFDDEAIERMLVHFRNLLTAIATRTEVRLRDLPLMGEAEREQLLVTWNDTVGEDGGERCIHDLFTEQVTRTPDAEAVHFISMDPDDPREETLTYAELDARVNQMANLLISHGVLPDTPIAVCLDRSVEIVVSLLGILRAGGAYVPIDPAYPIERLSYLIQDSGIATLITNNDLVDLLPALELTFLDTLYMDEQPEAEEDDHAPDPAGLPDNTAYVIYTSGSTGNPKGALVPHRAIVNTLLWRQRAYPLGPGDRVLQTTSFSFDASVWEFFGPLISGACLVLSNVRGQAQNEHLSHLIERCRITAMQLPPSWIRMFVEDSRIDRCRGLKQLITGAEPLPFSLQMKVFDRVGCQLHDLYGPTEAALDVTAYDCSSERDYPNAPIGHTITNKRVYLLDADFRPVPLGLPGQIFIGGGLARGYHDRPALTAESFVPDPFAERLDPSQPGERLYRTGDLARYLPNGMLYFLGRVDQQVKVRGFRIELGEIEVTLNRHPAIKNSAATTWSAAEGGARLAAYIELESDQITTSEDLRGYLREIVPEYMIPSSFSFLDRLPLSPNGKIDRKALPEPEQVDAGRTREYVAPRNPIEEKLARVWAEVLNREQVSVEDDFFELGGDSIISIQIIARASQAGFRLNGKQLFEAGTVARLAKVLDETTVDRAEQGAVTGSLPLLPIQHWFYGHNGKSFYNQSLLFETPGGLNPEHLRDTVAVLLDHHDGLRARFTTEEDGVRAEIAEPGGPIPFTHHDLSDEPREAAVRRLEETASDLQRSLDLEKGPLIRVVFFDLGSEGRLLLIAHHLVVDAVSWRILLEDLQTAFGQISAGKAAGLPLKTSSIKDWAERLSEHARDPETRAEVPFWTDPARERVALLPIAPAPEGPVETPAEAITVALASDQTESLLTRVHRAYNTRINDLLLAALCATVSEWTEGAEILVDLEGHGREELFEDINLTRTVGWLTAQIPVLLTAPGRTDASTLIKSIKEQLRGIPRGGIGYGMLRYLDDDPEIRARLEALPGAEISFNYLGQLDGAVSDENGFKMARESVGATQDPGDRPSHPLEINAFVSEGRLTVSWSHDSDRIDAARVRTLAEAYRAHLATLIDHCLSPDAGSMTPSDFPLARVDQATLDRIYAAEGRIEDLYPLSPMQSGLLFQSMYEEGSEAYFEQLSCVLNNLHGPQYFREAWESAVSRYTALRTSFAWQGLDEPLQIVHSEVAFPWVDLDWRELDEAERERRLSTLLEEDRARGFDLTKAPLMRWYLIRTGESRFTFVWSHHHMLMDGWSVSNLLAELFATHHALYNQFDPMLEEPRPYREYIAWLERNGDEEANAFWKEALAGFSEPVGLGREVVRDPDEKPSYRIREVSLSENLSGRIEQLAQEARITPNITLQGAWSILLSRYTGRRDLVFGATVSGRPPELDGVEKMVGLFINTLPVRVRVTGQTTVQDWLQDLHNAQVERERFSFTPLVEIQRLSEVPAGTGLFETLLVFANYPVDMAVEQNTSELGVERLESFEQTNFPLTISAQAGRTLVLRVEYDTDRFEEQAIDRMLGHLQNLFENIVDHPRESPGRIAMLAPEEREQLLVTWNAPQGSYPTDRCFHELFASQAMQTPDAIAVSFEGRDHTYRALSEAANRLARHLRERGAMPGDLIGIYLERGADLMTAMLAVLANGSAFLPLDPDYPEERLAFMIEDAAVPLVITREGLAERLGDCPRLSIDVEREEIARRPTTAPAHVAVPNMWLCVFYTSGSTGKPKASVVDHRAIVNFGHAMVARLGLGADDRVLQLASPSFDVFLEEVVPTLIAGGTVVPYGPGALVETEALEQLIEEARITGLEISAAQWHQWIADMKPGSAPPASLRFLMVGCERISGEAYAVWRRFDIPVYAVFGLSETAITNMVNPLHEHDASASDRALLSTGRPVAGSRIFILDEDLEPVPCDVAGELFIGGVCLAQGYLGRAALTASRFLPDPYAVEPGARLYRTGDLTRYVPDGHIELLGRVDDQLNLRGFRVEPAEIETVLEQHPAVTESAVVLREENLIAYVQPSREDEGLAEDLRAWLGEQLPVYMVPSVIISLARMPLTLHGKVDRDALPDPGPLLPKSRAAVPPRDETETRIAAIWQDLLGLGEGTFGVHHNFFELGGHSLTATRLVSRLRDEMSVELGLRTLFEAPTIEGIAASIARSAAVSTAPIAPAPRDEPLPLSFAQQRLWFLDRLEGAGATYNLPVALRVDGRLDVDLLQRGLEEIVARHDSLRTTFVIIDGTPRQVIDQGRPFRLAVVDLSGLEAEPARHHAKLIANREAFTPFDLERGPLLRVTYLRGDEQALLITMHHIIADGWSVNVFINEIATLYGGDATLPTPELQYGDFAHWQRQWLQGERLEAQIDYWRNQLSDAPELLELPTDRPRPEVQTYRGADMDFRVPASLVDRLSQIGRDRDSTLFMTLLSVFGVLLSRYSNQERVVIGSPIANRTRRETESMIGFFVNTLALHLELNERQPFTELLTEVRRTALDAYSHQDIPFERIVEELRPERSMSHSPIFQVMFSLENAQEAALSLPGLSLSMIDLDSVVAKFDLSVALTETDNGLEGAIQLNTDLFDETTIQQLAEHFRGLLEGVATDPSKPIHDLALLTEQEAERQLETWNQTRHALPDDGRVHLAFARQAERTPKAAAVIADHGPDVPATTISYEMLNDMSRKLARTLREHGVGPDVPVAIFTERTPEMVACMLAVLMAGGVYIPIDPGIPTERIEAVCNDAGIRLLLTQRSLLERLPEHGATEILVDVPSAFEGEPLADIDSAAPANLAYMLFTSGSTGRPKGVMLTHGSLYNHMVWMQHDYSSRASDRVLQKTPVGFDASIWEFYLPLMSGAGLVLAKPGAHHDPAYLADAVHRCGITDLQVVPTLLQLLLREERFLSGHGLERLFVGGEALVPELRNRVHQTLDVDLINLYGPTETTVQTVVWKSDRRQGTHPVPIGRPIHNTRVYILDHHLRPTPTRVPGELHLGGVAVSRGYTNNPVATAEKFIPDPFASEPGSRLYKTSDRARYLEDGTITYLGRMDRQLKIRGFRVELGEIEAVILTSPLVGETAVLAQRDHSGVNRLVAYVTTTTELAEPTLNRELSSYLRARLPDYMVPAFWVRLDNLPRTASGKLDRRALPALEITASGKRHVPPRTPTEGLLCGIWSEILRMDTVSIHDNFFESGGHSLLATQVVLRIQQVFGVEITLRQVFERPTVHALAAAIDHATGSAFDPAETIVPVSREQPLPLSFSQQRLWFIDQMDPGNPAYNIPVLESLAADLDVAVLEQALAEVMRRHEILRTVFPERSGEPFQEIRPATPPQLEKVDLTHLDEAGQCAEIRAALDRAAAHRFDLARDLLVRFALFDLGEAGKILLVNMHHIITDAWSINLLRAEVAVLHEAIGAERPSPLPDLEIQYADYAHWQRHQLTDEKLADQLAYWKKQLGTEPAPLELPYDHPPSPEGGRGGTEKLLPAPELTTTLESLARENGSTLFMTLLTAFEVLLAKTCGQDRLRVGIPVSGRVHYQTEPLIGFFVNTLVLDADLSDNPEFTEMLARVRQTVLEAYAHQDVPFERVVDAIRTDGDDERQPLFEVLFVYQEDNVEDNQLVAPMPDFLENGIGKVSGAPQFDLVLTVTHGAGTLEIAFDYRSDRFEPETLQAMRDQMGVLLQSIVDAPAGRVQKLAHLTEEQARARRESRAARKKSRSKKIKRVEPKAIDIGS